MALSRLNLVGNTNFIPPAGVTSVRVFAYQNISPTLMEGQNMSMVTTKNDIYMWGQNIAGSCGNGTSTPISFPTLVLGGHSFSQVVAGSAEAFSQYTLAIDTSGTMWAWGGNQNGQLGIGSTTAVSTPTLVLGANKWQYISQSMNDAAPSIAIDSYGKIWCWGNQGVGQLGNGTSTTPVSSPVMVIGSGLPYFKKCWSAYLSAYALSIGGVAYSWGLIPGDGTSTPKSSPVLVAGGLIFKDLFPDNTSGQACMGLTNNGLIFGWGDSFNGSLGNGSTSPVNSPTQILSTSGSNIYTLLSFRNTIGMAVDTSGKIWSWGANSFGSLGDGTTISRSSPVMVVGLPAGKSWVQVLTGDSSFALASDGTLWSWGDNDKGQLGDGTTVSKSSPVAVLGGNLFSKILYTPFQNYNTISAIRTDGVLMTWGNNSSGQLGIGSVISQSSPVMVITEGQPLTYNPAKVFSIAVTPGFSVPVNLEQPIAMFGSTPIGTCITSAIVEFDQ